MFGLFGADSDHDFPCPRCAGINLKMWKLPNLMCLHWVLNPGLMVNELFLGQRVPARMYFCRDCPRSLRFQHFVHCPGCGAVHDGMIWGDDNSFGHWLGLICPDCGGRIPTLLNVTSWLILWRLSPVCQFLWW